MGKEQYDAIVVGTGISGGWVAKELCEAGLKTLVIDRGREVQHPDYPTAHKDPWEMPNNDELTPQQLRDNPTFRGIERMKQSNVHWYMPDAEQPIASSRPFTWIRGDQVGGRSLTWGRQVYRFSEMDFEANLNEGVAIDWPIRYKDIEPWYNYVERYIGVSGKTENLDHLPDSIYLPPMEMNCLENHVTESLKDNYTDRIMTIGRVANLTVEHEGRGRCQYRDRCDRGCPYGAYYSSLSSTLPAAAATGHMTLITDTIVTEVIYDDDTQRATGVRTLDKVTGEYRDHHSRIVFLNASTFNSTWILMNSKSGRFPNGMGNDSGELGHNIMDHNIGGGAQATTDMFADRYYSGRRPNGIYIPRFQNLPTSSKEKDYIRGYHYHGRGSRLGWWRDIPEAKFGLDLKEELLRPGQWAFVLMGLGEVLPYHDNMMSLHPTQKDKYGLPIIQFDVHWRENEKKMSEDMVAQAVDMLERAGLDDVEPLHAMSNPVAAVHEMGTARMGHDPNTSVLNKWNQIHTVLNVYVTDGSCMTSSACQNPSLTYMALSARAAHHAIDQLKKEEL